MRIIIARHAEAEPQGIKPDPERELVALGREQARQMGDVIAATLGVPDVVWTSPLKRAHETARIAAGTWKAAREPHIQAALGPGGDLDQLAWALKRLGKDLVLLVGHLPDVGAFAARLMGLRGAIDIRKAGMCIVRTDDPQAAVGQAVATLDPRHYRDILEGREYAPWMARLRTHQST